MTRGGRRRCSVAWLWATWQNMREACMRMSMSDQFFSPTKKGNEAATTAAKNDFIHSVRFLIFTI